MDKLIFFKVFEFTKRNKHLLNLSVFVSNFSSKIFFIIYLFALIYTFLFLKDKLFLFIIIPLSTLVIINILRRLIKRNRPADTFNLQLPVQKSKDFSFPSKHATCSMIIALSILFLNIYFGAVLVFLSFLTGLSRVMTGLHYPFDILFGWLLAICFSTTFIIFN